jgi:hypothetical protein
VSVTYSRACKKLTYKGTHPLGLRLSPEQALLDQLRSDESNEKTTTYAACIALLQKWLSDMPIIEPLKKLQLTNDNIDEIAIIIRNINQHMQNHKIIQLKNPSIIVTPLLKRLLIQEYLETKQSTEQTFNFAHYRQTIMKRISELNKKTKIDTKILEETLDYLEVLDEMEHTITKQFIADKKDLLARLGEYE